MSDELNQENVIVEQELSIEDKIKVEKGKNPEAFKEESGDHMDALVKKKNELLNEKKKEQARNRQLEEELNSLKNMLRKQEEEKLEQNQEYKTLWENTQKEKEEIQNKYFGLQENLVKEKKIKEFNKVLGKSLSKDRYYDFVDVNSIIIEEDGSVNKDSVKYVVNVFRENYPELTPKQEMPKIGTQSPSNEGIIGKQQDINSADARRSLRSQLLRK
jgi:chromosome segregation ATPase